MTYTNDSAILFDVEIHFLADIDPSGTREGWGGPLPADDDIIQVQSPFGPPVLYFKTEADARSFQRNWRTLMGIDPDSPEGDPEWSADNAREACNRIARMDGATTSRPDYAAAAFAAGWVRVEYDPSPDRCEDGPVWYHAKLDRAMPLETSFRDLCREVGADEDEGKD
jgi:hypothetical protein